MASASNWRDMEAITIMPARAIESESEPPIPEGNLVTNFPTQLGNDP